ncbi:hypothetical protein M2451_001354 [Dysgonomonas sp. PFB1-18]|uniref:hypothetical protein n=1 Tax=unclassified Dysgonomonas TaxID=2630389 RepID=UPI0024764B27|nr:MULTISPECIES: hypothetical protein [unclassified Dysgonomonas]MDL2303481.1 hypothetical protein [Dysgonomonas sp. OttesenSCG-928-D17]MDH6308788.1 hypothetical protein [Dysgonomonas sp. PF1-14]MDH6338515.1 hypothetical protein [Dysgonomonas sp. PF1-16]MDH6380037.1 hypothetical protein [Dysgonomonas sp. PFB1-18]MDH6397343.1 hypothetical protein [Dysgonomonas sp. PF1-23]
MKNVLLLLLITTPLFFISCSDDDDEKSDYLEGTTWIRELKANEWLIQNTIKFSKSTCSIDCFEEGYDSKGNFLYEYSTSDAANYTYKKPYVTITGKNSGGKDFTYIGEVTNNTIVFYFDENEQTIFEKQ